MAISFVKGPIGWTGVIVALALAAVFLVPYKAIEFRKYQPADAKAAWGAVSAKLHTREIQGRNETELSVWMDPQADCSVGRLDARFSSSSAPDEVISVPLLEPRSGFFLSTRISRPYENHVVTLTPVLDEGCNPLESVELRFATHQWIERWSFVEMIFRQ